MESPDSKKSQAEKFKEAARQVEANDDEAEFDRKLLDIAKPTKDADPE